MVLDLFRFTFSRMKIVIVKAAPLPFIHNSGICSELKKEAR